MKGTSRSGWAAVAIAAERAGLEPGEGVKRLDVVQLVGDPVGLRAPFWEVRFRVGGLPAFGDSNRPAAYNVAEQTVSTDDVDHRLAALPDTPHITRATVHHIF